MEDLLVLAFGVMMRHHYAFKGYAKCKCNWFLKDFNIREKVLDMCCLEWYQKHNGCSETFDDCNEIRMGHLSSSADIS